MTVEELLESKERLMKIIHTLEGQVEEIDQELTKVCTAREANSLNTDKGLKERTIARLLATVAEIDERIVSEQNSLPSE